jgi:cytochrome c peroxidase
MLWEDATRKFATRWLVSNISLNGSNSISFFLFYHILSHRYPDRTASGYDGPWSPTPTTFNNAYYTLLANLKWVPKEWDGPFQYVDAPTGSLMMLPSDLVLLEDKSFNKWVKVYAQDGELFNKDFSKAFQKLEELGTTGLTPTQWA